MRKAFSALAVLLVILGVTACTPAPCPTPASQPSTTATWADTEAIGVVHTWLAEQMVKGEDSCLDYYSHHSWTAELINDGMWSVEAAPNYGNRTGGWYVYEATVSIGRDGSNIRGC